jgi:hypothetical protein
LQTIVTCPKFSYELSIFKVFFPVSNTLPTLALNVFQEFDLNAEDFSNMVKCFHKIKVPFKKEFKKVVHNNYIQKTKDKLSKLTVNH